MLLKFHLYGKFECITSHKFNIHTYPHVLFCFFIDPGLYYGCTGRKQSSTAEFLMAGRSMAVFPVTLSLLASFMSAITLLGTPAEIAVFGTQFWMIWLSYLTLMPIANYVFIPVFYNLRLTSVFEARRTLKTRITLRRSCKSLLLSITRIFAGEDTLRDSELLFTDSCNGFKTCKYMYI